MQEKEPIPRLVDKAISLIDIYMADTGKVPPPFAMSEVDQPPGYTFQMIHVGGGGGGVLDEPEVLSVLFQVALVKVRTVGLVTVGNPQVDLPHVLICCTALAAPHRPGDPTDEPITVEELAERFDQRWSMQIMYAEPDRPTRVWSRFVGMDDQGQLIPQEGQWEPASILTGNWIDELMESAVTTDYRRHRIAVLNAMAAAEALEFPVLRAYVYEREESE